MRGNDRKALVAGGPEHEHEQVEGHENSDYFHGSVDMKNSEYEHSPIPFELEVGPGRCWEERHRMPFNSRNEGIQCVEGHLEQLLVGRRVRWWRRRCRRPPHSCTPSWRTARRGAAACRSCCRPPSTPRCWRSCASPSSPWWSWTAARVGLGRCYLPRHRMLFHSRDEGSNTRG